MKNLLFFRIFLELFAHHEFVIRTEIPILSLSTKLSLHKFNQMHISEITGG